MTLMPGRLPHQGIDVDGQAEDARVGERDPQHMRTLSEASCGEDKAPNSVTSAEAPTWVVRCNVRSNAEGAWTCDHVPV